MRSVPTMDCGDGIFRADNGCIGIVEAKTASYTIKAEDTGKVFTNRGSAADLTFTLPTPKAGMHFRFQKAVVDKDIVINTHAAATKIHGGSGATQGVTATNAVDTEYAGCVVWSDGTGWYIAGALGAWTIS